jgi:hypothetical protein
LPAVRAESHAVDGVGVSPERERLLAGAGVPDLDCLVLAGGGLAASVEAERNAVD